MGRCEIQRQVCIFETWVASVSWEPLKRASNSVSECIESFVQYN